MNDRQIDSLLEAMRENGRCETDVKADEAICARFRHAVRRRRRITYMACAAFFIALIASCYKYYYNPGPTKEEVVEKLEVAQMMFPETGVSLVNGEISTYEKQNDEPGSQWLKLQLQRLNGKEPIRVDLLVAQEDYIRLTDGPVTGELLVSSCPVNNGETIVEATIVEFDLVFRRPDGSNQHVRNQVVLYPIGVSCSVGSVPEDYNLGLYLDSI